MILLSFLTLVSLAQVQSSNFDYETCINIACSACGDGYDVYTVNTLGSILTSNDGSNLCFHIFAEPELHKSIEKGLVEKMARIEKANSDRKISGLVKIELYDVAYPSDSGSTINTTGVSTAPISVVNRFLKNLIFLKKIVILANF